MTARYSVVISTYNQRDLLLRVLRAINAQDAPELLHEVIVVDDGSSDGTVAALGELELSCPLRVLQTQRVGPAGARNVGAQVASGEYLLFLDHDVEPTPQLLRKHHQRRSTSDERHCVAGPVDWPPDADVTHFMRFITAHYTFGPQALEGASELPFSQFATGNFSIARGLFWEHGGFDPTFPYGFEDTDLGLRLSEAGVALLYAPEALGWHLRASDVEAFCRRQEMLGPSAVAFARKHPDHPEVVRLDRLPRWGSARGALKKLVLNPATRPLWKALAAALSAARLSRAAEAVWSQLLSYHYYCGIARALAAEGEADKPR
ncbi:MAG: glycosyltransferase family 2 protein [Armatimonadota bacterium]